MILGHNMNFLSNTISQQSQNTLRVHFGKNNGMVEHQRRVLRTHERIAKTLGVVSCSFLFCWLPFFSLYLTSESSFHLTFSFYCFYNLLFQPKSSLILGAAKVMQSDDGEQSICKSRERTLLCDYRRTSAQDRRAGIYYKCHGCISPIAIDLASWLGYCNSMLNPIIYSFTVREFKRSALRIVIPTWQFAHRCLPKLIPSPPENMAQRMSRHGRKARNKTRHRSFELDSKKAALSKRNGQKRRQTEPAVFILQKKVSDAAAEVMIIEEDEEAAQDDTTDSNGFTTFHETSRRLSDLPQTILLPIAEISEAASTAANGDCKTCPNDNDCSIKVICDTLEADL
ncbi:hypothetical protein OESDEN_12404 [Oesophagostomum dentatum]|uniref:G-protein coupled receptors family 1 profile domain-containing protein n=1 Tax=Oesophagostomum dentatum TaxID=61180 RepID=A0A0B1SR72_OESDE|nr:hypothetical protein OESDEN_12404 [Oesophagostomum dentatum]